MIDIHSHILFGVDDGCETIEDSIKMIENSIKAGVTDLFLTPHFSIRRNYTVSYKIIEDRFIVLQKEVLKRELKIKLYLGSEIDEDTDTCLFKTNGLFHTLNNTKYILIDFGSRKAHIDDICYELIVKGYKPIIAHPERYFYIKGIDEVKKWKKTGALIHINASSLFVGGKVKKQAILLLKNKLVDIISSDTHRSKKTINHLSKAFLYIEKKYGKKEAVRMFIDNPQMII